MLALFLHNILSLQLAGPGRNKQKRERKWAVLTKELMVHRRSFPTNPEAT